MSQTERDLEEAIGALDDEFTNDAAGDDVAAEEALDDAAADDGADDDFELPDIIMATEEDDDEFDDEPSVGYLPVGDPLLRESVTGTRPTESAETVETPTTPAPETVDARVSDDLLDELRRANVDGPIVALAPQDDNSRTIRRPTRSADYDPAPFPIQMSVPRVLGRKPRVRRVTRVVRHVDPWTVFKIAFVANILLYFTVLIAGVLLWNVAYATGTVDNVERFFESFGWSSFEFDGGEIYHNAWIGGIFVVIGLTGLSVLLAAMFNLITDLVGGMRFTVLEEEVVEARPSPMRRFVVRRAEPEVPAITYDASGPIVRETIHDDSGQIPR